MKKSEGLFYLIKSLNKSEIRYFKQYISREDTNYLKLFEAIKKQKVYNEKALKDQFRKTSFVKQFTSIKYYLKQNILKALRNYHQDLSTNISLKHILINIEILYNKGLFALCKDEIAKGEKIATDYENHVVLYQLNQWKRKLFNTSQTKGYHQIQESVDSQIANAQQLVAIACAWKWNLKPENAPEAPIKPSDSLELASIKRMLGYQKKFFTNDIENGVYILQEIIEDYEKNPHRLKDDPSIYLTTLNNLVAFHTFQKEADKALMLITKIKSILHQQKYRSAVMEKTLLRALNFELELYRDEKMLAAADLLIPVIQQTIKQTTIKIPISYKASFWFQFGYIQFMNRDFDGALHWINQILNNKATYEKEIPYKMANWLNLMIHVELKNFVLIRYFVDSFRRFLKNQSNMEPYEQKLLQFFSRLANLPPFEIKAAFVSLKDGLDQATINIDQDTLDFLKIDEWVSAHI